ncbi:MAG: SEL1-like repeat protein [Motiliproteus sp.]
MLRRLWRPLLLLGWALLGGVLAPWAQAEAGLAELVAQLKQGQVVDSELSLKEVQSADGLFLLGWLYQQGSYGVKPDLQRGRALLQQAAEKGQFDAMHYCWQDCLDLTPEVLEQLRLGVESNHVQALYLQSQLADVMAVDVVTAERSLSADQLLLEAARQGHRDAIGKLYVDHFLGWARQKRTQAEAVAKLQRCVAEGVVVCYYLLGRLYERHNDHQRALFYYLLLQQVDPELFRGYIDAAHIAKLLAHLPQPSLALLQSRVASYLAQQPSSGNPQIDRFKRCGIDYPCIRRLARTDASCLLPYFETSYLHGLRDSAGYRACQASVAVP